MSIYLLDKMHQIGAEGLRDRRGNHGKNLRHEDGVQGRGRLDIRRIRRCGGTCQDIKLASLHKEEDDCVHSHKGDEYLPLLPT